MKYIKHINENHSGELHVVYWVNDQRDVDILGIFESMEDADIYILNYINSGILELYDEIVENQGLKTKEEIESQMFGIIHYTTDRDSDGNLVFLDPNIALDWNYNREDSVRWKIDYQRERTFKPTLNDRIKNAMEIKKYNL